MKRRVMIATRLFLNVIVVLILAGTIINCGGGSSAGVAKVEAPKSLIQDFIAKHNAMIDSSLVNFYVADERPTVAAKVQKSIDEKTASGEIEKLRQATFDFSNLQIAVVDEKEAYVNDQPTKVIKVSVTGSYNVREEDKNKTIPTAENIILEWVNNTWKVTEKNNPFS